ncbi:MAG: flagellar assembly protein FliX [Rhodospirillales bacterium]|nr:flagellar assembly protein FliX [Alphaproteobacteria bacterium]MBL6947992.1 flagellar assembly protein FliX [Rhodospirillales bacterium]
MKISRVGPSKQSGSAKKKKSSASAGEFADQVRGAVSVGETGNAQAADGASPVGAMDSILAVQEVPDATDGRSKGILVRYGDELLERLDEIRLAILSGVVSKERLADLAQKLRQKRQTCDDPRLNEIIDEIELRAEVEVAKLTRGR